MEPAPDAQSAPLTAALGPTMAEILEKYGAGLPVVGPCPSHISAVW